jgi:hypothetical protein
MDCQESRAESGDCGVSGSQGDDSAETERDGRIHTPCSCHISVLGSAFLGDRHKEWIGDGWGETMASAI